MGPLVVPYSNSSAYGRMRARGPSRQKLSILIKTASFRPHAVDIDMENCRPTLLARVLRGAYSSGGNDEAMYSAAPSTLRSYLDIYKEWRTFAKSCNYVSLHGAKKSRATSDTADGAIGATPRFPATCAWAFRKQRDTLRSTDTTHLGVTYRVRKRPLYGHIAPMLIYAAGR